MVTERAQRGVQRIALADPAFHRGGGLALRFVGVEGKPARTTELAAHGDAHKALARQVGRIQAQVDIAHHGRCIVDLAVGSQHA